MDVARLNFSHGDPGAHSEVYNRVRMVSKLVGRAIGVLQDLPGPKIRIGNIRGGTVRLERGKAVRFVPDDIEGTPDIISLPSPEVLAALKPGSSMYLADGLLHLRVTDCKQSGVTAKVIEGGVLGSHKGVNLPGVDLDLSADRSRDLDYFKFGLDLGMDWAAISFVESAKDAVPFREEARRAGSSVRLMAKIERRQALKNIDEILNAFDGVLVARGDLGIEIPIRDVPIVQKTLIKKCNALGKPVVVATQMLMSMVNNPRPTRAEATDVANAILDGADAVMLSEETAVGKYPGRCAATMSHIASSTENYLIKNSRAKEYQRIQSQTPTDAIAMASARLAEVLQVEAILTCTASGATARAVSKHRPTAPILAAVSGGDSACGQLALSWGVKPFAVPVPVGTDDMIESAVEGALATKMVKLRDTVVITAGVRAGVPGNTSLIKYHRVGDKIWG